MRSQLTVRMPDDLRAQLEAAARKRGRNLTDELLGRLGASFAREHEQKRDPATRALMFLISRAAKYIGYRRPNWHRNPFCFHAFRLAVGQLLEALEPPGEIRPPFESGKDVSFFVKHLKTPEAFAEYAAELVIQRLEYPLPLEEFSMTQGAIDSSKMKNPIIAEIMDDRERENYGMYNVRRALQLGEKKGG
jgi:Arc-like DNA binding domain